ncbi:mechanosensitive ion channel family protein [Methylonatrum kenyense]|uniref:mechanosensitive ion channel family protein n=1 Tax=Methylonatrum kenyense TaxID=455253 RepID=UPI0020BF95CE|nr:mechanosensitive ion channel family protein [Methylonatrum kenyense]MCK8515350.1 mechanosensitive ion channel family protein [Methylonatrum kenyense]
MVSEQGFFSELLGALRRSLIDTFGVFETGETDLATLAASWLSQLIVSVILISIFLLAYLGIRRAMRAMLLRIGLSEQVFNPVFIGLRYVFFLLTALAIMAQLGVSPDLLKAVARAAMIALMFYVAWAVVTKILITMLQRYQLDPSIEQLMRNVVSVLIVAFGIVTVLAQFGFDILSVVAGLGIVGLAVGFAAQSTLSNFIAGITILLERPFRIGDWVRIHEQDGKVMKIALRTTWLRTRDNVFTMIPNESVASSDIINYSTEGPIRVRMTVGIAYKESIAAARAVILPILEAHEDVLALPDMMPSVNAAELADSSVNLRMSYWIQPYNIDRQPRINAQLLESIKEGLDAAGIEIPFPHLQLFIDDAKGLAPVLEPFQRVVRQKSAD